MVEKVRVGLAKFPYAGQYGLAETGDSGEVIEKSGLKPLVEGLGCEIADSRTAELIDAEEKQYGTQNRMGLGNRHLSEIVSAQLKDGLFPIGLLQNCNGLMGMLAGVQHSGSGWKPIKVGLVWVDAHGDFNTPETTLSGMLGGMPVAISTGQCLHMLRRTCGLEPALPTKYVTMVAVRDTDPWEQDAIDRSDMEHISTEDVKGLSANIDRQMGRLSDLVDQIYVHVDMDVLDPPDIPGHGLPVPGGPTRKELAAALGQMFQHPKACSFGIASYPSRHDPEKIGLRSVYALIEGVLKGVQSRAD